MSPSPLQSVQSLQTLVLTLSLLFTYTLSTTCSSPKLSTPPNTLCAELPALSSALHYSYTSSNKTLFVAFSATPPSPSGWVAWGINPTATGMAGTQAILAYKNSNGSMSVMTLSISSYNNLTSGELSFPVYQKRAEFNSKEGSITIYASVKSDGGKVNHVWQVGPGVAKGFPMKHEFGKENLQSTRTLDLSSKSSSSSASGGDNGLKKRNTHGILNAISWGMLLPIGAIIARYLKTFESAEPTWFYLHITCQISGYAIGVAGWATGLQLGNESKGFVYKGHRCIGFVLFCLATLQIFALLVRPKKDHKYRFYWNIYHHGVGYAILTLGIINVFKGLDILQPENKWKSIYITILIVLGCVVVLLEAFTWIVILRRKSNRSTKPYA